MKLWCFLANIQKSASIGQPENLVLKDKIDAYKSKPTAPNANNTKTMQRQQSKEKGKIRNQYYQLTHLTYDTI